MITTSQANDGRLDQLGSVVKQVNDVLGYNLATVTRKPLPGPWSPDTALSGLNTTVAVKEFLLRIEVTKACLATGVAYLVGDAGGTGKVIGTLYDESGSLIRASALAGATIGTAGEIQSIAFALGADGATAATTVELAPGIYWIGVTFNEATTRKLRTIPAQTSFGILGAAQTRTFGTLVNPITPPTTFTAAEVPVASLY